MAKTIANAQTSLAYRLGESSVPSSTTELAKRIDWFTEAINLACGGDELMWFMKRRSYDTTVADQSDYSTPTRWRKIIQVKVDGYKYDELPYEEVYEKYELPTSPVPILPSFMARAFYVYNDEIYLIPIPSSAPSTISFSSITQSGGTATATTSSAHGLVRDEIITISGATPSAYNGAQTILTVPSTTTFTFAVDSGTSTPATGTITGVKKNILIDYYEYPNTTSALTSSSSIIVPDNYLNLLVSYAEGRYWSTAFKRAKASDAFTEFETLLDKLKKDNFRKMYLAK